MDKPNSDSTLSRLSAVLVVYIPYIFMFIIFALGGWPKWDAHDITLDIEIIFASGIMLYFAYLIIRKSMAIVRGEASAWGKNTIIALCGEALLVAHWLLHHSH